MDLKPTKGLKVKVSAQREAVFGEESVDIRKIALPNGSGNGVMTGLTLAGYCEVEMQGLDGHKHWFPIGDLKGENGENIVEEEIPIDVEEDAFEGPEEEPA
ncbi:MAG TPA: hypothetical protein VFE91_02660 [Nitrososphaerales archaeon]|nr:hypothetical protein [Nitrososphaerales archaeon]